MASDALLRPALQFALDVARIAAAASPTVEAPRVVKPFLHFSRLPDQALAAVRRALDEDVEFRARVEMLADEGELGRAGWLFVVRPEGWEDELAELAEQANIRDQAQREEREERSARRRLRHAEEATERAAAVAARAQAESARVAAELAVERRERRAAQDDLARTARRATTLEGERDSARRRVAEATAEAETLRAEAASLHTELTELRTQLTEVRTELQDRAEPPELPAPQVPAPAAPPPPVADVAAAAGAVAAAATAAASLARALSEASVALGLPAPVAPGDDPPRGRSAPPASPLPQVQAPKVRPPPSARRRPAALPPAVFDDTVEAANHLVRVPDVLVLVDGYNAAKALWPDVAPVELRERLVDALSELEARTGSGIHVVFDGADIGGPTARLGVRRAVRVTFSPSDVEADDVILDLVDEVPVPRPVVVASSDRRVQDGARTRGANVISSAQLAAVLGRA